MLRAVPPLTLRISVVFSYVKELDRARGFYRDVLGLTLHGDDDWQQAQLNAAQRLREAGAEVGEITRLPYGAFCDFTDPAGYRLQLFQPAS